MKRQLAVSFGCGLLFAVGLGISGMTQPAKVIGFLDIFGNWDFSLMFVMGGAVGAYALVFQIIRKQPLPKFSDVWHLPTTKKLDRPLFAGAALFGIGWGLSGFCPGPALVSLVTLSPQVFVFVGSMVVGMRGFHWFQKRFYQS